MGNTPSSMGEAPKRSSHRLSKPRIGNPATAGLLSPNGLSNSSGLFASSRLSSQALPLSPLQAASPVSATSAAPLYVSTDPPEKPATDNMVSAPTVQPKESRRRSLFRSLSSQKSTTAKATRRTSSVGPAPRASLEVVGRANSMTAQVTHIAFYAGPAADNWSSSGSRRTSQNYDMSSYEAKRLLNLAEEAPFERTAAMSENRPTVVSEATWKSSNPIKTAQAPSAPISRANSDLSLYTPVRRRSIIQTPGVATRTRASPATSKSNFRHSHPPTPSMSRQQSRESMRSGVISMPPRILDPESVPRVLTPCEAEYQSIGAFKLGSLRITNGAASPVTPDLEKTGKAEGLSLSVSQARSDYFSGTPVLAQSKTVEAIGNKTQTIVSPQPRVLNLSPIAASFQEAELRPNPSNVADDLSAKVTETPLEYLADISFSPFSLTESQPLSPQLQITSKHTAIEDELFDDDGNLEYSSVEVLDVRLDINAKSLPPQAQQHTQVGQSSVTRTDSGFVSAKSPSEAPHKQLTKADSGYSSNVSLRSFHASKSQVTDNEATSQVLEKHVSISRTISGPFAAGEQQPQSPVRASSDKPAQPQREAPPPPVPPKDSVPVSPKIAGSSPFKKALATPAGLSEARLSTPSSSGKPRHTPSPINSMPSSASGPRSPDSALKTPLSGRSDVSTSALSIGSGSNKPSKLQRLLSGARRSSHGPPMVHVTHALDKAAIPSIPQDVETKLHEHTGLFPMSTKRLALKPQQSKDTLKTIFSVGSVEVSLDAMNHTRSASPASGVATEDSNHDGSHGRHLVHSVQSSIANAAAHIIPRKPIPRKAVPTRQTSAVRPEVGPTGDAESELVLPVEAELTSYTAVTSSLGDNPYDAAVMAMDGSGEPQLSPLPEGGRSMSLTTTVERNLYMNVRRAPSASSLTDHQGIALPSPLLPRETIQPQKTKTPPPVSMMTRRPISLRVPPPLRSQSSAQSLSRKSSRENVHSYPSYQQIGNDGQPSLSRKQSRENVHSYPSYQQGSQPIREQASPSPPPIPPLDPRRLMSFRNQGQSSGLSTPSRAPNREPQSNYGVSRRSSMSSMDSGSRSSSVSSSARAHEGLSFQRSSSTQPYPGRPNQQLRHRASYDGYSNSMTRGHPPSMSNGYTAPVHAPIPAAGKQTIDPRWVSQRGPQPQMDQYGIYPPHVPRGHYRHRSLGNRNGYPANPPYRILHSYNSPAYRNVPIWG